ncbi:hypothetical protein BC828DRAFT_407097 [Blastocladiella britannica]|nr:hypothetical protein BC828DRAFT_407097 [Blastocladiella britannica]
MAAPTTSPPPPAVALVFDAYRDDAASKYHEIGGHNFTRLVGSDPGVSNMHNFVILELDGSSRDVVLTREEYRHRCGDNIANAKCKVLEARSPWIKDINYGTSSLRGSSCGVLRQCGVARDEQGEPSWRGSRDERLGWFELAYLLPPPSTGWSPCASVSGPRSSGWTSTGRQSYVAGVTTPLETVPGDPWGTRVCPPECLFPIDRDANGARNMLGVSAATAAANET